MQDETGTRFNEGSNCKESLAFCTSSHAWQCTAAALLTWIDTWVVGRYLGKRALAAVGASYTLMTFLTSVVIGLCLGAGAFFADGIRQERKGDFPKWDFYVLYGNWRSFDSFDNTVVWLRKTAYLSFAGAGGDGRRYGNVSHICICRIFCYIFV